MTSRLPACLLVTAATWVCMPMQGHAQQSSPQVTAADRHAAQQAFAEGQRAFTLGDFQHAAESFEKAYQRAPHHAALWNAARSWQRAGEGARAANLYAKYLREAPPNAPDRNSAIAALKKLSGKLARLEIHAAGMQELQVDGEPVQDEVVYVSPGTHLIEAKSGDRTVRQQQRAEAGAVVSVALLPPPVASSAPRPPPPPPPPPPVQSKKWSPTVVYVGGAITLVLAGATTWSGLNTLSQKDTFDAAPTQDNLDEGHARQTRTNVLLACSLGAAALTGAAALWLVDWGSERSKGKETGHVQAGVAGNSLVVRGSF